MNVTESKEIEFYDTEEETVFTVDWSHHGQYLSGGSDQCIPTPNPTSYTTAPQAHQSCASDQETDKYLQVKPASWMFRTANVKCL